MPLDRGSAGKILRGTGADAGWVASVEEREAGRRIGERGSATAPIRWPRCRCQVRSTVWDARRDESMATRSVTRRRAIERALVFPPVTSDAARAVDRRLLALAVPALFTLAAEPLYVLADTAIVGHLGTGSLAGLGLASIVLTTSAGLCNVLTWGTTSRVGFLRGAGDDPGVGRVAATVLWLAVVLGGFITALLVVGAPLILRGLGGTGTVLDEAITYLRIGSLGLPALLLGWAGQGVARGEGDTRGPLAVVIAANVANLVLEVLFVYVFDWGIAGSAWGTVLAQWGAAAVFGVRLLRRSGGHVRPDRHELRGLAHVSTNLVIRTGALFAALTAAAAVAARISSVVAGRPPDRRAAQPSHCAGA